MTSSSPLSFRTIRVRWAVVKCQLRILGISGKHTPRASVRDVEMVSPFLWWKLRIWFCRDEIPELSCRPFKFARGGVDDGFDAFFFR